MLALNHTHLIKIKEVTRVSINPGDMLVVHIDTEGLPANCLSESVIGKVLTFPFQ